MQYRMPEAYDQDGVVDQEKRFAVAMQRYRLFSLSRKLDTHKTSAATHASCRYCTI